MSNRDPAGSDPRTVEDILELVANGALGAEEADALLGELDLAREARVTREEVAREDRSIRGDSPHQARIEVTEGGRTVVNMRVPIMPFGIGRHALSRVPGLSGLDVDQISNAIERGLTGRILEVQDEDGDGVRIVVE